MERPDSSWSSRKIQQEKRRTNRMDFKTFKEEVKENVRAHLPNENTLSHSIVFSR